MVEGSRSADTKLHPVLFPASVLFTANHVAPPVAILSFKDTYCDTTVPLDLDMLHVLPLEVLSSVILLPTLPFAVRVVTVWVLPAANLTVFPAGTESTSKVFEPDTVAVPEDVIFTVPYERPPPVNAETVFIVEDAPLNVMPVPITDQVLTVIFAAPSVSVLAVELSKLMKFVQLNTCPFIFRLPSVRVTLLLDAKVSCIVHPPPEPSKYTVPKVFPAHVMLRPVDVERKYTGPVKLKVIEAAKVKSP